MYARWALGFGALVVGTLGIGVAVGPQPAGYRVATSLVFAIVGVAALVVSAAALRGWRWHPAPRPAALVVGTVITLAGLYVTITGLISLGLLHILLGVEIAAAGGVMAWGARGASLRPRV